MERSRRFVSAVGSGYASVVITSVLGFITVPFALAALGREGLGVAATIAQIAAFSQIIQLGVGPSVARFIADFESDRQEARLASFIKLAFFLGFLQAVTLLALAFVAPNYLTSIFKIPSHYKDAFVTVLCLSLCAISATMLVNPLQQLLYATQRIHLINYITVGSQIMATVALLAGFSSGLNLYSYIISAWVGTTATALMSWFLTKKEAILPPMRGVPTDWSAFPRLFRFSGNVMMASVGLQVIALAPALVINRLLGATAMGDWSVGTRALQLGLQLTGRVSNAAEPTLWQIYERREYYWCRTRLKQTSQLSASIAVLLGGLLISLNGNFVNLWSGDRVSWPWLNDFLGAGLLFAAAFGTTWCMIPGITKRLGLLRYVYPVEGLLVVALLLVPVVVTDLSAVLAAMLASMVLVRVSYGVARLRKDFDESLLDIGSSAKRSLLSLVVILPVAVLVRWSLEENAEWQNLLFWAAVCGVLYAVIAYAISLSPEIKAPMYHAASRMFKNVLGKT